MENLPQRKKIRLQGYDYSQDGAYFITICTQNRCQILSDIGRGGALLRPVGAIAETEIEKMSGHFGILISKFVIMPNHIHLMVMINRAEQSPAPTVGDMICAFKSITTKLANLQDDTPGRKIWQRSYHDHIIRSEQEYQKIGQYIDTNPLNWRKDCFFNEESVSQ